MSQEKTAEQTAVKPLEERHLLQVGTLDELVGQIQSFQRELEDRRLDPRVASIVKIHRQDGKPVAVEFNHHPEGWVNPGSEFDDTRLQPSDIFLLRYGVRDYPITGTGIGGQDLIQAGLQKFRAVEYNGRLRWFGSKYIKGGDSWKPSRYDWKPNQDATWDEVREAFTGLGKQISKFLESPDTFGSA